MLNYMYMYRWTRVWVWNTRT